MRDDERGRLTLANTCFQRMVRCRLEVDTWLLLLVLSNDLVLFNI
jgi:hypothetical protein